MQSNKEQMAIVVRFEDSAADIREYFLGFVQCTDGVTGRALADLILAKVEKWGLGLEKLRGQGYDGAGNMAGHINGCAALIRNEQPAAMYFHCASHLLNLSVVSLTNIPHVRNMWDILTQVSLFFKGSPKRESALEKAVEEQGELISGTKKRLVDLCRTRWVERHDALVTFADLYPAVVALFQDIEDGGAGWNMETKSKAASLLNGITRFAFIVAFQTTAKIMAYIFGLTVKLQSVNKDICKAYQEVSIVQENLVKVRNDIDNKFNQWWDDILEMADQVRTVELD